MLRLCLAEISATAAFTLIDLASAHGWQAPFLFLPCLPFQWSWKRIPTVISKPGRDLWYTAGQWHSAGNDQFVMLWCFFKWSKRSEGWTVLIPEECTNKLETQNDCLQRWWFFLHTTGPSKFHLGGQSVTRTVSCYLYILSVWTLFLLPYFPLLALLLAPSLRPLLFLSHRGVGEETGADLQ